LIEQMAAYGVSFIGDDMARAVSPIAAFWMPDASLRQAWVSSLEKVGVQFIVRGDVLRLSPWALSDAEMEELRDLIAQAAGMVKQPR